MALVTGSTGWLGSNLVRSIVRGLPDVPSLAQGSPDRVVRCLVLPNDNAAELRGLEGNIRIIPGDITVPSSLQKFFAESEGATLFHCAGIIHPDKGVRQFYDVNVEGTKHVMGAAEASGVKRVIHVSSNSPIGCNPHPNHVFDESSPYNPYMNYGNSKKLAEDIVNNASRRGNIETVIIRPPWFYGPRQPLRQTVFFSMIKNGRFPLLGNGTHRRSMAYVDNICQGALLCEQVEKAAGRTYWIADRTPYTMTQIVDTVERVMERDFGIEVTHKRLRIPGIAAEIALLADKAAQGLGFYYQKLHVLSEMNKTIACSIGKAEKELGYHPQISLEEGMRRSLLWITEKKYGALLF
jgi:nucleoside-diphosphate-sugar epimerase